MAPAGREESKTPRYKHPPRLRAPRLAARKRLKPVAEEKDKSRSSNALLFTTAPAASSSSLSSRKS